MNEIRASTVLRRLADVRYRVIDDEGVVVRQAAGEVLVLNQVATRILALADGTSPVAHWVEVLAGEFDVDRPTLERDVLAFAAELVEQGLVEARPATAAAIAGAPGAGAVPVAGAPAAAAAAAGAPSATGPAGARRGGR